jgi:hypothetical protein
MGENSISLFNISNGNKVTMFDDDTRYQQFKYFIQNGEFEDAEKLDIKIVVQNFGMASSSGYFGVVINNGIGTIQCNGEEYPLQDVIAKRILKMNAEGFDARPLVNFLENLYSNPSKTSIDELFLFLDSTDLPITEDGCFIAYKIVKEDYMDIYTGKISNKVGQIVTMPRFTVDDKRENTCSTGLHFCSKDYLKSYGSSNQKTDKCVLVKINPKNVVSIPSDYNNAKGRTCQYEVVGEMNDPEWRKILSERDYNTTSVVPSYHFDYSLDEAFDNYFYYDYDTIYWNDSHRRANITQVVNRLVRDTGYSESNVLEFIENLGDE